MLVAVDVEATGGTLSPPYYSMLSIGAVIVEEGLQRTFYSTIQPFPTHYSAPKEGQWDMETIRIHKFTPEMASGFPSRGEVMASFDEWLLEQSKVANGLFSHPIMLTDTCGFDWMHISYYMTRFVERNRFGFQGVNVEERYEAWRAGYQKGITEAHGLNDMGATYRRAMSLPYFSKLKKTPHTHNALDDAMGLAESTLAAMKLGFTL